MQIISDNPHLITTFILGIFLGQFQLFSTGSQFFLLTVENLKFVSNDIIHALYLYVCVYLTLKIFAFFIDFFCFCQILPGFNMAQGIPAIKILSMIGVEPSEIHKTKIACVKYILSQISKYSKCDIKVMEWEIKYIKNLPDFLLLAMAETLEKMLSGKGFIDKFLNGYPCFRDYWVGLPNMSDQELDIQSKTNLVDFTVFTPEKISIYTVISIILCIWLEEISHDEVNCRNSKLAEKIFAVLKNVNYPVLVEQVHPIGLKLFVKKYYNHKF